MSGKLVDVILCEPHKAELDAIDEGWRIANLGIEDGSIPDPQFVNAIRVRFAKQVDDCEDCKIRDEEHHLEGPVGEAS